MHNLQFLKLYCPSTGAWGLLHGARKNREKFYDKSWPKFAPQPAPLSPEPANDVADASEVDMDLAYRIACGILSAQENSYVEDTPLYVAFDVQHRFFTWQRRHNLELPREARKDLEELMVGIACNIRHAFEDRTAAIAGDV